MDVLPFLNGSPASAGLGGMGGGRGGCRSVVCVLCLGEHSSSKSHLCCKSVGLLFLHAHKEVTSFRNTVCQASV